MVKIGTSGFSFPDWVGPIYPSNIKKNEMLVFYQNELGFKITEINFTYYAIPSPKSFESMMKKTAPDFEFTVKAHKSMTHEIKDKRTGKFLDNTEAFEKFSISIEPLVKEGRLTAVLAQFPYSFYATKDNYQYLLAFQERLKGVSLVVEFRNVYWHNEYNGLENLDQYLRFAWGDIIITRRFKNAQEFQSGVYGQGGLGSYQG